MGVWTAFWSERAERAERVAQQLADELERALDHFGAYIPEREYRDAVEALHAHRDLIARRQAMLPAGPMADW